MEVPVIYDWQPLVDKSIPCVVWSRGVSDSEKPSKLKK